MYVFLLVKQNRPYFKLVSWKSKNTSQLFLSSYSHCLKWQLIISKNQSYHSVFFRLVKWWRKFGSFKHCSGPHVSRFPGDKTTRGAATRSSWRRRGERGNDACLDVPQLAFARRVAVHVLSGRGRSQSPSAAEHPPTPHCPVWKAHVHTPSSVL